MNIKELNELYQIIHEERAMVMAILEHHYLDYTLGYYPYHSFKENNEFFIEQYPIPVLTIQETVDIGIDINQIFFEFKFTREDAVSFDYKRLLPFTFEVYGVDDFYHDFYLEEDIESIIPNILNSSEQEVGLSIILSKDDIEEDVLEVINFLESLNIIKG